ncbi:unnamed protein product [Rotaria sp. Silwood1]|nr:unnamed protein product [Rotaria sp. Silwood1]
MFNRCSPSGDVIIIDSVNTHPILQYTFRDQFIIPSLTTVELWSSMAIPILISSETQEQQQSFVCIKTKL